MPQLVLVWRSKTSMTDTVNSSRNIAVDSIAVSSEDGAADTTDHGDIVALDNITAPNAQRAESYWTKFSDLLRMLCCVPTHVWSLSLFFCFSLFATATFLSIR